MKRKVLIISKLIVVAAGFALLLSAVREKKMTLSDQAVKEQVIEKPPAEEIILQREPTETAAVEQKDLRYCLTQTIQVLIQNDGYCGYYHDEVMIGTGAEKEYFIKKDNWEENKLIGKWDNATVYSIQRADGNPTYEGRMELYETPDGYVLINSIDLESYIKSVLPGEMPSTYPTEALKAQAVCARTYAAYQIEARRKWMEEGQPQEHPVWNYADVDDSTAFQVYANRKRTPECDAAVDATSGEIRLQDNEPQLLTYYSTSALDPMEEEEAWYRWEYENKQMSAKNLGERMIRSGFVELDNPKKLRVYRMSVSRFREDGRAEELVIETNQGTFHISGEYNIRGVLCDGVSQVTCQDGSKSTPERLLPSAFFALETIQNKEYVIGYKLSGGGFGHGDGLSQNGAKAYAKQGYSYSEILNRYYQEGEWSNR